MAPLQPAVRLRQLARRAYEPVWQEMRAFTNSRDAGTADEFWLVEHPPVFTLGQAGGRDHLLAPGSIPVVLSDRGGQVTYHGPGQLVMYTLVDLKRLGIGIRSMVERLEDAVMTLLTSHGVVGERRVGAPGVYVDGAKVAALGLRVRNGRTYHGLALNVDLDLEPFSRIHPCGYAGMRVTSLREEGILITLPAAGTALARALADRLGLALDVPDTASTRTASP